MQSLGRASLLLHAVYLIHWVLKGCVSHPPLQYLWAPGHYGPQTLGCLDKRTQRQQLWPLFQRQPNMGYCCETLLWYIFHCNGSAMRTACIATNKTPFICGANQCQPISIFFIKETISTTIYLMPSNCVSKAIRTSKSSNRTSKCECECKSEICEHLILLNTGCPAQLSLWKYFDNLGRDHSMSCSAAPAASVTKLRRAVELVAKLGRVVELVKSFGREEWSKLDPSLPLFSSLHLH